MGNTSTAKLKRNHFHLQTRNNSAEFFIKTASKLSSHPTVNCLSTDLDNYKEYRWIKFKSCEINKIRYNARLIIISK